MPVSGGAIFVNANNTDIVTLADLKGKRIIAGLPASALDFQVQALSLVGANLSIYTDPAGYLFTNNLLYILEAVLNLRTFDVGFMDAGSLNGNPPLAFFCPFNPPSPTGLHPSRFHHEKISCWPSRSWPATFASSTSRRSNLRASPSGNPCQRSYYLITHCLYTGVCPRK